MLNALHGNAGLPGDLAPLLAAIPARSEAWHLWQFLEKHPGAGTLWGFASEFQRAADARSDSSPRILLGYSLGARLAMHVLTTAPEKWDAAILISAHPGLISTEDREARLRTDQAWAVRFLRDNWRDVMQAWNAQPVFAGESMATQDQLLVEAWRPEVARGFDGWSLARQEDLRPKLSSIPCPVLWLTGERDEKFTTLAAAAFSALPRGEHHLIAGAGHRVHLDQPAEVARELWAFIERIAAA